MTWPGARQINVHLSFIHYIGDLRLFDEVVVLIVSPAMLLISAISLQRGLIFEVHRDTVLKRSTLISLAANEQIMNSLKLADGFFNVFQNFLDVSISRF